MSANKAGSPRRSAEPAPTNAYASRAISHLSEPRAGHSVSSDLVEEALDHRPTGYVATARAPETEHGAGPALAHLELATQKADGLAERRGLHHSFATTAFSA